VTVQRSKIDRKVCLHQSAAALSKLRPLLNRSGYRPLVNRREGAFGDQCSRREKEEATPHQMSATVGQGRQFRLKKLIGCGWLATTLRRRWCSQTM